MAAKKLLALLLALCLTVSLPVNALAAEKTEDPAEQIEDMALAEADEGTSPVEEPENPKEEHKQ